MATTNKSTEIKHSPHWEYRERQWAKKKLAAEKNGQALLPSKP